MSFVRIEQVTRRFGAGFGVVDLSLSIERGQILALLGPSGSGKTTTLRLLAGFERADSGRIVLDGRDVTALTPAERRCGMVFQSYALFPHMTVGENIAFGIPGLARSERDRRVAEVLAIVDLPGFAERDVTQLSGGQQQRVAVARALAPNPDILLLDEPLSNLDPSLRERTRLELRAALHAVGITSVFVTHEQEEAFALGDMVAVLRDGRLEQLGPAPDLYDAPANLFVAGFVGRGSVVQGTMTDAGVSLGGRVVWPARTRVPLPPGTAVDVLARPESLRFTDSNGLGGTILSVRFSGARAFFTVETEIGTLEVEAPVRTAREGDRAGVTADFVHAFPRA